MLDVGSVGNATGIPVIPASDARFAERQQRCLERFIQYEANAHEASASALRPSVDVRAVADVPILSSDLVRPHDLFLPHHLSKPTQHSYRRPTKLTKLRTVTVPEAFSAPALRAAEREARSSAHSRPIMPPVRAHTVAADRAELDASSIEPLPHRSATTEPEAHVRASRRAVASADLAEGEVTRPRKPAADLHRPSRSHSPSAGAGGADGRARARAGEAEATEEQRPLHAKAFLPLIAFDDKALEPLSFERHCPVHARSRHFGVDGTTSWERCRVEAMYSDCEHFRIRWLEGGQSKVVTRLNLLFDSEDEANFKRRIELAEEARAQVS